MPKKNQPRRASGDNAGANEASAAGSEEELEAVTDQTDSEEELTEEQDDLEPEIAALLGLAQMDAEASASYLVIAEGVENPEFQRTLKQFAEDHEKHLQALSELVGEMTDLEQFEVGDPQGSTFVAISEAMASIGPRAALRALKANELFTNAAYAAALEFATDPDIRELLEIHMSDEERHSRWLADTNEADWEEVDETAGKAQAAE